MSGQPQLVFGDDGSAAADVVWLWINNHRWPGWRISVVTAQHGTTPSQDSADLHPWSPNVPRVLFDAAPDAVVEHLTAEADPRIVLDGCRDATLIVIGPRGTGALKAMRIGSTAEWLLSAHRPLAPLAIIRSARPTRHVMLCVDGSTHAQRAAEVLATMPWIGECRVTILGVSDGISDPERGASRAAATLTGTGASLEAKESAALRGTYTMDVKSVLLDLIAEEGPDLVALGTRGLGGLQRLMLGSTASAVAHHAHCSTLIARDPATT